MHVIRARNVNSAFPSGLKHLAEVGQPRPSRAGDVIVSPYPVTTVYERPAERVLFWPARDANPFFHLFSAIWCLAGRNDGAFLDRFVHDYSERFTDNGVVAGAYGHRWRHWPTVFGEEKDQLVRVIEYLRRNPHGRRAVLQMWDPDRDLYVGETTRDVPCNTTIYLWQSLGGRDEPNRLSVTISCRSNDIIWGCLAGDTLIKSPEGDTSIADLALQFRSGLKRFPVYAVDTSTGNMSLKWCYRAWRTGVKPVRELIFDNGSRLRLTKDHILYLKKTKPGITNSPACIQQIQTGDLKVGDRIWSPWFVKPGQRAYFKRNILKNTSFSNKQIVSRAYYELLHGHPPTADIHHKDEDFTNDRADNLIDLTHSEHMSDHMTKRLLSLTLEERSFWAKRGSLAAAESYANLTDAERECLNARKSVKASENMKRFQAGLSREEKRRRSKIASDAAKLVNTPEELSERGRRGSSSRWSDPEQHRRQSDLMCRLNAEGRLRSNHKIIAIEELSPEPVYDFTVEDYHTALIGDGVLAHNCYGENSVVFSVLQEYVASHLGLGIGPMYQVSNNFHAYEALYAKLRAAQIDEFLEAPVDPYAAGEVQPYPMVQDPETWDMDLALFLEDPTSNGMRNRWFTRVAKPLFWAHEAWRRKDWETAFACVEQCVAVDWSRAARQWLERRRK